MSETIDLAMILILIIAFMWKQHISLYFQWRLRSKDTTSNHRYALIQERYSRQDMEQKSLELPDHQLTDAERVQFYHLASLRRHLRPHRAGSVDAIRNG